MKNGMRYVREFKGFAGIRLEADDIGSAFDPAVVILHSPGQTRADWEAVALALREAGRHAINIDLRGHGGSEWPSDGRYDFTACVEDVRAVLSQMRTRPVVVAVGESGWIASAALADDDVTLAAALVLVDLPAVLGLRANSAGTEKFDSRFFERFAAQHMSQHFAESAASLSIPVLAIGGDDQKLLAEIPNAEIVMIEDSGLDRTESFNAVLLEFLERKQPRFVPEFREGSDARTFRDALGCFATGVTIITAMDGGGKPIGLTANSFTSVSLDPPLLLVCIANNAGSAPVLREAERFAVNVLQIGQQPTSNRFAGKGEDRFATTPWELGEFGTPVLTGSLSSFECERDALHEGGDHFILVGRVLKAMFEPRRDPLLYFRGKYRRLHFA
jgi:flavin reductase (DIM6/NTAB) family NADH-FMN oxidoreductase RutF